MSRLLNFIGKLTLMVFILYFQIHPLDGFSFMKKLDGFYLCEEVGSRFPFSHLFIEDVFKGSSPCAVEL